MNIQQSELSDRKGPEKKGVRLFWVAFIAMALIIVELSVSIKFVATNEPFYDQAFEQLDSRTRVGLNETDFESVKQQLIDYVALKTKTFSVMVEIDGKKQDFFNDKERSHMEDVRGLFVLNSRIMAWACIFIISAYGAGKKLLGYRRLLIDGLIVSGPLMLAFIAVIGLLATQDFNSIFVKFHELFFTNDLWLLDPATDRMIVLLQEEFFSFLALRIGMVTVLVAAFGTALGIVLKRNLPK